jgi:uncharacterized membrane protein YidH (DUF202 family)
VSDRPRGDDEETPGLAGERTDLAWSRSGLAVLAAVGAIIKRIVDTRDDARAQFVVAALLVGGGAAWLLALAHSRVVAAAALAGRTHADQRKLQYVAWGTAAFAFAALVLAIAPEP